MYVCVYIYIYIYIHTCNTYMYIYREREMCIVGIRPRAEAEGGRARSRHVRGRPKSWSSPSSPSLRTIACRGEECMYKGTRARALASRLSIRHLIGIIAA